MTSTELERAPLPVTAAPSAWTPQQGALMQFVGLAIKTDAGFILKPNAIGVAEAFLAVCRATGLDPFARQIYAMETNQGYAIVVGVDGFRVVAQRSKGYRGQIGPQWFTGRRTPQPLIVNGQVVFDPSGHVVMTDQEEWVDAWTPEALGLEPITVSVKGKDQKAPARPVAARIGILREGFTEPLWQVVTWDEFGVEPRFSNDNWLVRPAHMLGIRAETHGLRRTFPNDLSGLYTPEDFDAVDETAYEEIIAADVKRIESITDLDELKRVYHELNAVGMPDTVRATIMARAGVLGAKQSEGSDGNGADPSATVPSAAVPDENAPTPAETPRGRKSAPTAAARAAEHVEKLDAEYREGDLTTIPADVAERAVEEFALEIPTGETGALSEEEYERAAAEEHARYLAEQEASER